MSTVKRYRRRDLINELVRHQGIPAEDVEAFKRGAALWPNQYLAFVFRDVTGREIVPHKCGLFYAMAEHDQEHDQER